MTERRAPLPHPPVGVIFSSLSPGTVDAEFMSSWTEMIRYDCCGETGEGCGHWIKGGEIQIITGPRVAEGRTQIVEHALTNPAFSDRAWEWLLCIDSDMVWDPDALCQLLGYAYSIDDKPKVIGGLCFAGGHSRIYPTIYAAVIDPLSGAPVVEPVEDFEDDALIKVGGTGAAFMLIHRGVLTHMYQDWPVGYKTVPSPTPDDPERVIMNPYPWFVEGVHGEHQFGEDIAFCQRARALGYGVYVHTGVEVEHVKRHKLNKALYRQRQAEAATTTGTRAERRRAQRETAR